MLDVRHATVAFSAPGGPLVRAVDDVSFTIPAGTFVVVIGTNGSGKSTLLGAIAGTVRLDAGSIHVAGHDLTRWRENRRAQFVGRVFQDPRAGTASSLSVLENIAVATHTEVVGALQGTDGAALIASILVVEARHVVVLLDMAEQTDLDALLVNDAAALSAEG